MKKILFFEKLDFVSFFMAILLRPIFGVIKFRTANTFFQRVSTHKFLKLFGIEAVYILKENNRIFHQSFKDGWKLEDKFINDNIKKNILVNKFIDNYNLSEIQKKKLYLSIRSEFFLHDDNLTSSTIKLVQEFFPKDQYKIYYFPSIISSSLLLFELQQENIKVINFHLVVLILTYFFKKVFLTAFKVVKKISYNFFKFNKFSKSKSKNKFLHDIQLSDYKVAFFPHNNLKYADFFKKTYIYENEKNSPLFREKVLTIFLGETDQLSKRYLDRYKIPNINLNNLISSSSLILKFIKVTTENILLFPNKEMKSLNKIFTLFLFVKFQINFKKYISFLNKTKSLKAMYVHYDILFPQCFVLACNVRGVTTISSQERPSTYTWVSPLIYDIYLTAGEGFSDIFKKLGYPSKFISIGLPRSIYIDGKMNECNKMKLKKFFEIKKKKKIVICFGLAIDNTKIMCRYGEVAGSSPESIIHFVEAMLHLAKNYKELYFIIRFKRLSELFEVLPLSLQKEIENTENIEIQKNLKKFNSYDLANIADLIIGKGTSIVEESLSARKKIILYDNESYITSKEYPLNQTNLISTNLKSLNTRVNDIIKGKYDESETIEEFTQKYYRSKSGKKGFDLIRDVIIEQL